MKLRSWVATFLLAAGAAALGIGGLTGGLAGGTLVPFFICAGLLVICVLLRSARSRSVR